VQPPSTGMTCPVTWEAPSEQRKTTTSAASSGSHQRPSGTTDNIAACLSAGSDLIRSVRGVWTNPGATAFTRIPWVAYCSAADLVRPDTPCLLATLAIGPATPTRPTAEPLFTIAPPPRFNISGTSYFMQSQTPVRLAAITRCQSSSLVSTTPAFDPTNPAL